MLISIIIATPICATTNNYFGTSGALDGSVWNTTDDTYASPLNTTGGAIIYFNNEALTAIGGNITVSGININANVTINTIGGTISNYGNVVIPISVGAGFTFNAGTQIFDGATTAGYIKNGDGVLAFAGQAYEGGFTLNAGTVILTGINAMGFGGPLTINGGTIAADANRYLTGKYTGITIGGDFTLGATTGLALSSAVLSFNSPITLGALTRTITIGGTANYTLDGVLSGAANVGITVNATAAGTLVLGGANTYTGATTINSGASLRLQSATALGTIDAGTTVNSGANLDLYGTNYTNLEPLSIAGTGVVSEGAISNGTAATATFAGPLTLAGTASIVGGSGLIVINNTSAITGTGNLTLSGGVGGSISSPIANTGNIIKSGTGTWTLSGANSYSGSTTINTGNVILGAAERIPNTSNVIFNGGTLSTGSTVGYTETAGTLDVNDDATIALGTGSHTLTFADSHLVNWVAGKILTITGWNRTSGGRIYVGSNSSGLDASQLALITFTGYTAGAKISSSGEIFPSSIILNGEDIAISNIITNSTADMTIQSGGKLTVDASNSVNNLTVEAGGKLVFTGSPVLTVAGNVSYKADKTTSFSVNIGTGSMAITGNVNFYKTMDKSQWFFMSFPCTISVNDIIVDGVTTGAGNATGLGTNWFIKYYAGDQRIVNLGATTNWVSVAHGGTLTANKGYIIGLANAVSGDKVLVFPLTKAIAQSETAPPVPIIAHGVGNGSIAEVHKGWNLVGHPFLSKYTSSYMGTLSLVTLHSGGYYSVAVADGFTMDPFTSFFVQATANGNISFDTDGRQSAPSAIKNDTVDRVKLILKTATGEDNTNLMLNDNYALDYKIGEDLEKWISTGTERPQIYSNLNGIKYAFNGLPISSVQNLALGLYTNTTGAATLSADLNLTAHLGELLLTDTSTGITTDLLKADYSFTASAGINNGRFLISAQSLTTSQKTIKDEVVVCFSQQGTLLIKNIKPCSKVTVYDMLGHLLASKVSNTQSLEIPVFRKGVYVVHVTDGENTYIQKVVN